MGWWNFIRNPRVPVRDFVADYEGSFQSKLNLNRKISDLPLLVLDTETTGVDIRKDFILSYGSIKVKGNSILVSSTIECYLKSKKLSKESIKVHELIPNQKFVS